MTHEPECPLVRLDEQYANDCTYCDRLRAAYRRGFNAHAAAQQHWQDTHGAYRQQGPYPRRVKGLADLADERMVDHWNQHGQGENP